ncbi:MAG: glycosyltransferase [Patescibacteria group bacterium]
MDIHIIILNYNGMALLKKHLPSVIMAHNRCSYKSRITILDNGSTDGSLLYVRENFPEVNISISPKNLVLISYNAFIQQIKEKVILLLNNDVRLSEDCIDLMMPHFLDSSVFFVSPLVLNKDGNDLNGGCMDFSFKYGLFQNKFKQPTVNKYSLFIGSSVAFDRDKFLALSGYDSIYLPGTYEDVDICYRAWQRGWFGICEKKAIAYHDDSASFNKEYGNKKRQIISARNAYIFVWKNIHSPTILCTNIICYPLVIIFNMMRLRFDLVLGYLQAIFLLPAIFKRRIFCNRQIKRTDSEIKQLFNSTSGDKNVYTWN